MKFRDQKHKNKMLREYSEHNSLSKDYILQHVINRAETNNGSNVLSILEINLGYNNNKRQILYKTYR